MISLSQLTDRGLVSHRVAQVIRTQDGMYAAAEVHFSRLDAAALMAAAEFYDNWPTLGRTDLLALYKRFKRAFNREIPAMTYDIILSSRMKLQLIPRLYIARVDIAFGGVA